MTASVFSFMCCDRRARLSSQSFDMFHFKTRALLDMFVLESIVSLPGVLEKNTQIKKWRRAQAHSAKRLKICVRRVDIMKPWSTKEK